MSYRRVDHGGVSLAFELEREKLRARSGETAPERPWLAYPHTFAEYIYADAAPFPGQWHTYEYLRRLSLKVGDGIRKGNARIAVSMPPQHGKSNLLDIVTPLWVFANWPNWRIALACYEADFAAQWGDAVLTQARSNPRCGIRLNFNVRSKKRWKTADGGQMITAGIGGGISGNPADVLILDDLLKNDEEAYSKVIRDKVYRWIRATAFTRVQPQGSVIIVATRWHEDDPIGRLVLEEPGVWDVISIPAIAEKDDPLGRTMGEYLSSRFSPEFYEAQKAGMSTQLWNALYQQRPSAESGDVFQREWFNRFWVERPADKEFDQLMLSWDMSFKDAATSSFVVGQAWGRKGADLYLLHQTRERMDFSRALDAVVELANLFPKYDGILIEEAANGAAIINTVKEHVQRVIAISRPSDSKASRARAFVYLVRAGNIVLPAKTIAPWVDDFIEEFCACPNGRLWDQIDAADQAWSEMRVRPPDRFVAPVGVYQPSAWADKNERKWSDGEPAVAWGGIN